MGCVKGKGAAVGWYVKVSVNAVREVARGLDGSDILRRVEI